jgi:hypothetical protein
MSTIKMTSESATFRRFHDTGLSAKLTLCDPPKAEFFKGGDDPLIKVATTGTGISNIKDLLEKIEQIIENHLLNKQKLL